MYKKSMKYTKSKKSTKPKKATFASKAAVTKLVKSVVAKQEETKFRSLIITDRVGFNGQITSGDAYPALPKLSQDTGDGTIYERLGRKISVRKCYLDLDICLNSAVGERSTAIVVHVWVLNAKEYKTLESLPTIQAILPRLLMLGDTAMYQQFNGFAQDYMLPLNSSNFTLIKKHSFLLGKNTGTIQDSTTAGNQPLAQAVRKQLRVNLKGPKEWTYEQDNFTPRTQFYPKNFAPFFVVGYHHQDQTTADLANTDIMVTSRASVWYDDA